MSSSSPAMEIYGGFDHKTTQAERRKLIDEYRSSYPTAHIEGQIQLFIEASRKLGDDGQPRNAAIVDLATERELRDMDDLLEILELASYEMMIGVGW